MTRFIFLATFSLSLAANAEASPSKNNFVEYKLKKAGSVWKDWTIQGPKKGIVELDFGTDARFYVEPPFEVDIIFKQKKPNFIEEKASVSARELVSEGETKSSIVVDEPGRLVILNEHKSRRWWSFTMLHMVDGQALTCESNVLNPIKDEEKLKTYAEICRSLAKKK